MIGLKQIGLIFLAGIFGAGCGSHLLPPNLYFPTLIPIEHVPTGAYEIGLASWYGAPFHGRQAASGETYDMYQLTAAHPSLPLHTMVRVINPINNKGVVVRINDRGPFVGERIIDLSFAAAQAINLIPYGTTGVLVEVIRYPDVKE